MTKMLFYINGTQVTRKKVNKWETQRLKNVYKYLSKYPEAQLNKNVKLWVKNNDLDNMKQEIAQAKLNITFSKLRKSMRLKYTVGNLISAIATKLSFGQRKMSTVEIAIPNSHLNAQEVMNVLNQVMMQKTPEHDEINVKANPDHYVLEGITAEIQEVLETTGGSPLPTHFFAHYNDETKLKSRMSEDYQIELPGVAKLKNGMIIGGMRHQIRNENHGFRFKALVEFPAILPNYMIHQHQYHLCCEFGNWLTYILEVESK